MKDEIFGECWKLLNLRQYSAKQNVIDNDIMHQKSET